MKQKTLEMIEELKKDYYVKVEGKDFRIDNFTFTEWKDDNLLVTYYKKTKHKDWRGDPEYDIADEVIPHEIDEVMWWVNTDRDY